MVIVSPTAIMITLPPAPQAPVWTPKTKIVTMENQRQMLKLWTALEIPQVKNSLHPTRPTRAPLTTIIGKQAIVDLCNGKHALSIYLGAFPGNVASAGLVLFLFTLAQCTMVACVAIFGQWSVLPNQMPPYLE